MKNYYTLSRLHRFQKKITQISIIFQCVSYLCNRSLIGVIRDFETFSEISKIKLDKTLPEKDNQTSQVLRRIKVFSLPIE